MRLENGSYARLVSGVRLLSMTHEQRNELDKAKARSEAALALLHKFVPPAKKLVWILVEQGSDIKQYQ
jgi:hypothetical protein